MYLDSPSLSPGWQYNLNAVNDIKVTTGFMNHDNKGCSKEAREDCSTRSYVSRVTQGCGCLPFSTRTEEFSQATHQNIYK